jgi:hemolysin activation/secretion protein
MRLGLAVLLAVLCLTTAKAQQLVPQGSPIPRVAPAPLTAPTLPPLPPTPLPPATGLPATSVAVNSVAIEGATAYPLAQLQALAQGLIGPRTSLADIDRARRSILLLYRSNGYSYVTVAARLDAGGVLHIAVVESYIAEVKLSGEIGPAGTLVLRFLQHLVDKRPLNDADYEHWVLLANSIPGIAVAPLLQRLESEPGAFTLIARVTRAAVSGSFSVDNNAFPQAGREQGLLTVGVNSLSSLGERSEASFYLSGPDGHEIYGQASETFFVGSSGLSVRLYGGTGRELPCCSYSQIGYDSKTTQFGALMSYPLVLRRQQQLYLRAAFDAIDVETLANGERASADDLRVLRAEADYTLSDTLLGTRFDGTNAVTARLSKGLTAFGASAQDRPDAGRLHEDPTFFKFNAEISRDQTLYRFADGPRVSLFGLVAGQASPDVLPNEEQFYLGGLRFTRGFYSGEVVGDNAVAATAELRVTSTYLLDALGRQIVLTPQFYGFYDDGETWQNQATDANQIVRSYGIGLRLGITDNARLELIGVRRDTRQVGGQNVPPVAANAFYFRIDTFF